MTKLLNKLTKPHIIDMEYYIYHVQGVKIGMTKDLEKRMADQGFTEWEILETHTDGWLGGDREQELQAEYGYPVDSVHYMVSIQNRRKFTKEEMAKGGRNSIQNMRSKLTKEACARGGSAGRGKPKPWAKPSKEAQSKGGKGHRYLTFEQAEEIRAKYVPRKYTAKMLAEEYGVKPRVIFKIIYKESYITP